MGRKRSGARAFFWSLLIVSALWAAGVLGRLENYLAAHFVDLLVPHLQTRIADELAIIVAEESAEKNGELRAFEASWRRYHAQMIDALARAGARVVALDLTFRDPAPGDAELAQAIRRAGKLGTRVILGAEGFVMRDGVPVPQISTDLRPHIAASQWALVSVGQRPADSGILRRVELARVITALSASNTETVEARVAPSLALQILAQYRSSRGPAEIGLHLKESRIRIVEPSGGEIESIPAAPRLEIPIELPGANELNRMTQQYHLVWANRAKTEYLKDNFKDKIVLIACRLAGDSHKVPGGETRFGYEVHAAALSSLLQRKFTRPPHPALRWLAIFGMSAIMAGLHIWLPGAMAKKVTLPALKWVDVQPSLTLMSALIGLVYLAAAFVMYQGWRIVLEFSYPLCALLVADILAGRRPAGVAQK